MNVAWISGRAGLAVIDTGKETFLIVDDDDPTPTACSPRQLSVLWSTYSDVSREDAGVFPFQRVRTTLHKAVGVDRARLYVLGLLDREFDDDLRRDLASDLEFLLSDTDVRERLLGIMRSAPVPGTAELHRGIELAAERSASQVLHLLSSLNADGPVIHRAHAAWTQFAAESFVTDSAAASARLWFAQTGGFHYLVESILLDSSASFVTWVAHLARTAPPEFGPAPLKSFLKLQSLAGLPASGSRGEIAEHKGDLPNETVPRQPARKDRPSRVSKKAVFARDSLRAERMILRSSGGEESTSQEANRAVFDNEEKLTAQPERGIPHSKLSEPAEQVEGVDSIGVDSTSRPSSQEIAMKDLLESGAHFGREIKRLNPKMKEYIFGERNGIFILDLGKTVKLLKEAEKFVSNLVIERRTVLFVGTKRLAKTVVAEEAARCEMFYLNERWTRGLLTNFVVTQQSLNRLRHLETIAADGSYNTISKKEAKRNDEQRKKLATQFNGIRNMSRLPDAIFIVDTTQEKIAVDEARKLKIPVIGLVNTDGDPDEVDFIIPANNNSLSSIRLFASRVANAVLVGKETLRTAEESLDVDGSFDDSASSRERRLRQLRRQRALSKAHQSST